MLVYTASQLKNIRDKMASKGDITTDVYLVLRTRSIWMKTQRGKRKYRRAVPTDNHSSPLQNTAGTEQLSTTEGTISPLQMIAGTEQLSTNDDYLFPLQHTNKRNTVKQQLNIDYFNCRSVTMKKASEIAEL